MLTVTRSQLPVLSPVELPVVGSEPRERADAARNRQKVLEAAACLFAREGADKGSMEAVGARAGGGEGTLLRRVGGRGRRPAGGREGRVFRALRRSREPPPGRAGRERAQAAGGADPWTGAARAGRAA